MRHYLNCLGFSCPMPIVKLFQKNSKIAIGDTLEVVSDDAAFFHDVKAWCQQTGNILLEIKAENKNTTAIIQKAK